MLFGADSSLKEVSAPAFKEESFGETQRVSWMSVGWKDGNKRASRSAEEVAMYIGLGTLLLIIILLVLIF